MNSDELIERFLSSSADTLKIAQHVDDLARSDALATLRRLQREVTTLNAEIAQLQQHKSDLQAELEQLGVARIDHLLVFLPVFFRNFWTVVRPDELALMCGRLDVPELRSPYLEPSPETVQFMKCRFQALAEADREPIVTLCRSLRHRLHVRAEMRELLP